MFPLALYLINKNYKLAGSDRYFDNNIYLDKKKYLISKGVEIYPENGMGIDNFDIIIRSSAVEDINKNIEKAIKLKKEIFTRSEYLSKIINNSNSICIAGTSGKSTTTLLLNHILRKCNVKHTVIAGAEPIDKNINDFDDCLIIAEIDESDGSLPIFKPKTSYILNITEDHKKLNDLINDFEIFSKNSLKSFCNYPYSKYIKSAINVKSDIIIIEESLEKNKIFTKFIYNNDEITIPLIGKHNIENSIAAIKLSLNLGIAIEDIIIALRDFKGVKRRLEIIGWRNNTLIIDDFAHNNAKINSTLKILKKFKKKVKVIFQPHGYSPIKNFGNNIAKAFTDNLTNEDFLHILPVYYAGGTTVNKKYNSIYLSKLIKKKSKEINLIVGKFEKERENYYDIIITMGARNPHLAEIAKEILLNG